MFNLCLSFPIKTKNELGIYFMLVMHQKSWDGRHLNWEPLTSSCLSLTASQKKSRSKKTQIWVRESRSGWNEQQMASKNRRFTQRTLMGMKTTASKYLENTKKQTDEDAKAKEEVGGASCWACNSRFLFLYSWLPTPPTLLWWMRFRRPARSATSYY